MDDNSNGPTGILYVAIGALVIAVAVLAYFVLGIGAGAQNHAAVFRAEPPISSPFKPISNQH